MFADFDMIVVTQIAYYDFDDVIWQQHKNGIALQKLLELDQSVRRKLEFTHRQEMDRKKPDRYKRFRAEHALWLYDQIVKSGSKYGAWILREIHDDNAVSGFYGCLLEADGETAIIGFRGSESTDSFQVEKDWVDADLGLLNSVMTGQQAVAEDFVESINQRYYYQNYYLSGHSLGGNLTAHAVVSASAAMLGKIVKGYSFDGPGFSDEYLRSHGQQIERAGNKVIHYQWSLVGNLLFPLPGSTTDSVQTEAMVYENYDVEALLQKHDTGFVSFSKEGCVIPGAMDSFAGQVGEMTRSIEECPAGIGNFVLTVTDRIVELPAKKRRHAGLALLQMIALEAVKNPTSAAIGVFALSSCLVIGVLDGDFWGKRLIPEICRIVTGAIHVEEKVYHILGNISRHTVGVLESENKEMEHIMDSYFREIAAADESRGQ